jgi:zinc protease
MQIASGRHETSCRARRRLVLVVVLLLAAAAGAACRQQPALIRHHPNLQDGQRVLHYQHDAQLYDTQSGMRLLVLPNPDTNLVRVDVRYFVGAAEDPQGKSGLAHLAEHVSFQLPIGEAAGGATVNKLLSTVALYYNAYTIWDETHFTAVGMRESLPALLAIEAARMRTRCEAVDDATFARERDVVRNEIRSRSSQQAAVMALMQRAFYGPGHAYARPVGGTDVELAGMTRADACTFLSGYYAPDRAILTVSGNVDIKAVVHLTGTLFGTMSKRASAPRTFIAAVRPGATETHDLDVEEATAFIAVPAAPFASYEAIGQRLLVTLFEERLFDLVDEHDFLTEASIDITGGVRAPMLLVALSVRDPGQLDRAVKLFFRDVAAFQREELAPDRIVALRERRRARLLFSVEPFLREAPIFTDYLQYADHDAFIAHELERIQDIRPEGLKLQAEQLFSASQTHVLHIRPNPAARAVEQRAELRFSPDPHDTRAWEVPVDDTEADKPLPVPPRQTPPEIRHLALDNGLRVLLAPALEYPVVDIRLVFPVGSLHEPENRPGLATLAMMLLTPNRPRVRSIRDYVAVHEMIAIQRMGGDIDRYGDERTTTFRTTGLAMYLDGLLWNLYWLIETGIYPDEGLERVQKRMARAQARQTATAAAAKRYSQALVQALFGADHPYARPGVDARSLGRVDVGDLERFRDRYYRLGSATLIVTGRFDAYAAEAEIRRLFGDGKRADAPPVPAIPAAAARRQTEYLAVFDPDSIQTDIVFAFDTEPGLETHEAARQVLSELLDERMSLLRFALGATYGVSVTQSAKEGPGIFLIHASVDRERSGESLQAMRAALDEVRTGNITAAFVRARRRALFQMLADALHSERVADRLEHAIAQRQRDLDHVEKLIARLAALRPDELRRVIARELAPAHQVVLIRGQRASVEAAFQAAGITGYRVIE